MYLLDIVISFNKSKYIVDEDSGHVQVMLTLSSPPLTDITMEVTANEGTASGELTVPLSTMMLRVYKQEVVIMILDHSVLCFLLERPLLCLMCQ